MYVSIRGVLRNTGFSIAPRADLSPKTAKRLATAQGGRGPKGCRLLRARTLMPHLRSGIRIIGPALGGARWGAVLPGWAHGTGVRPPAADP